MKDILRFFVLVLITAVAISGMGCWPVAREKSRRNTAPPARFSIAYTKK